MNIFRLIADMLHLLAIVTLLYRIYKSRNCIGKSSAPDFVSLHSASSAFILVGYLPDLLSNHSPFFFSCQSYITFPLADL